MNWFHFLTAATELADGVSEIPDRPATLGEALKLMGLGWGCIFIVILVIALVTILLNRVCRD